jgi:hypothetical protein
MKKHLMISVLLAGGFVALSTMDANAVVCARGVYRAGCVATGVPPSFDALLPDPLSLLRHGGACRSPQGLLTILRRTPFADAQQSDHGKDGKMAARTEGSI